MTAPGRPILEIEGLQVAYGAIEAVRGIDLRVGEGEIVALVGPNGAGKSSAMNAILGLVRSTGTIRLDGDEISGLPTERRVRRGLALAPEGRRIFPELTVEENLVAGGITRPPGEARRTIESVMARFPGLRDRRRQASGTLSGGEQQMLAIGRALMSAPRALLLDEPSLGLAPQIVEQIFELVSELKDDGLSILLVEQNAEDALAIADRGYVMASGTIRMEDDARTMAGSDALHRTIFGEG